MMELGNDVINSIYEANYRTESHMRRATSDCDNSVRELWIKAKYVDKSFVITIDEFKNAKNTFQENTENPLNDIVFNEMGWLVQRVRRNRIHLRNDKPPAVSTTDDSASGSELSMDSNRPNDDLSFTSDNDSTDDDDEDMAIALVGEKLEDFNTDLLLYRATIVHNLPIMCYAMATGASKNWKNERDLLRAPIHQAVLSVSYTSRTIFCAFFGAFHSTRLKTFLFTLLCTLLCTYLAPSMMPSCNE